MWKTVSLSAAYLASLYAVIRSKRSKRAGLTESKSQVLAEKRDRKDGGPKRIINSIAPIRICDLGGWTDTWFAGKGILLNIGVYPYCEVQLEVFDLDEKHPDRVVIHAENYGDRYAYPYNRLTPEDTPVSKDYWTKHPLLEAAISKMGIPDDISIEVHIHSLAPAGASTGTSASVTVALIGALDRLSPGRLTNHEVAYLSHSIETEVLGQQCGIQDQLCAAYGGINFIDMWTYPHASVSPVTLPNSTWWELERRLVLIFLGKSHFSSRVHEQVIHELEEEGSTSQRIKDLRSTAKRGRDALFEGDFEKFGEIMIENTQYQEKLNPSLICPEAHQIIAIAKKHNALGWKVNGAGGDGGSITILCDSLSSSKRAFVADVINTNPKWQNIPIYLSRTGLRVWEDTVRPPQEE